MQSGQFSNFSMQNVAKSLLEESKAIVQDVCKKKKIDFSHNVVQDFYDEIDKRATHIKQVYHQLYANSSASEDKLKEFLMNLAVKALCRKAYKDMGQDITYDIKLDLVDRIFFLGKRNACVKVHLVDPIFIEMVSTDKTKIKEIDGQPQFNPEDVHKSGIEIMYKDFTFLHFRYREEFHYVIHALGSSSLIGDIGDFWQVLVLSEAGFVASKRYQLPDNVTLQAKLVEAMFNCLFFLSAKKALKIKDFNVSSLYSVDYKGHLASFTDLPDLPK